MTKPAKPVLAKGKIHSGKISMSKLVIFFTLLNFKNTIKVDFSSSAFLHGPCYAAVKENTVYTITTNKILICADT